MPARSIATIYLGLGQTEDALDWLEKAYEERSIWLILLKEQPIYDSLRGEPRFENLVRKLKLPV